ncbi:MAG TPA: undecaprenyldiphospho-muramoylpentapeptide beta-N-acetylglucosaminyltransferase [Actinomycetota bacterium]|jgi:UDP-N-acetylglucosamine--N-acetylmuramyl-(pentapeptide) pyrophosphoryl-undecaprenol N-acetylglucosamine transferase
MKVVIAAGGTAGHVNPALALAEAMSDHEVSFIGTRAGFEGDLVTAAGLSFHSIEARGFDRSRPLGLVPVGLVAVRAVRAARKLLRRICPRVVVGMGGYVSLPVALAARSLGIPVVVHEQNIVLGLANKVARRWARAVAVSFEETLETAGPRGVFVGDPVARAVVDADVARERERGLARFDLDPGRRTLIVFGGSLGALRVNEAAAGLAVEWRDRSDRQIVHILGRRQNAAAATGDDGGPLVYRRVQFVERMVEAYAVADLALCRGGATTVAELAVMGLPAIIVPYPHHRDRQQERHGRVLERAGAAIVLPDADTTAARVADEAGALLDDGETLVRMSKAARSLARPRAAHDLAEVVLGVAG